MCLFAHKLTFIVFVCCFFFFLLKTTYKYTNCRNSGLNKLKKYQDYFSPKIVPFSNRHRYN